jgi:hypothetical protein
MAWPQPASVLPAAVLRETATVFVTSGPQATVVLHGDRRPAFQRFWQDAKTATTWVGWARPALPVAVF